MKPIKVPTQEILNYLNLHCRYDPDTGIIVKNIKKINTSKKNAYIRFSITLSCRFDEDGICIRRTYGLLAHQVAWYLTYKVWPDKYVDHIDGDKANNKLNNLRLATPIQSSRNVRKSKRKTSSKYKGVSSHKNSKDKPWRAMIKIENKHIWLGHFATEDDAARAYDAKATELHGEYARLNFGPNSALE